jgi:hypothetical protein
MVQFVDKHLPRAWIWKDGRLFASVIDVALRDMKETVDAMVAGVELRSVDMVAVQLSANRRFPEGSVIVIDPPKRGLVWEHTAIVCISTMTVPYDFTGMAADDERVVRILANPDFIGYSNAEEFITMQHVKNKLGHPLMLGGERQRVSEDIATWLERTEAAIRHTLRNGTVVSGKDSVDSGGVRGDGVGGKN